VHEEDWGLNSGGLLDQLYHEGLAEILDPAVLADSDSLTGATIRFAAVVLAVPVDFDSTEKFLLAVVEVVDFPVDHIPARHDPPGNASRRGNLKVC